MRNRSKRFDNGWTSLRKIHSRRLWVALLLGWALLGATPALAAPVGQDDPVTQCAEGVQRLTEGDVTGALPLLEAGIAGRERATFADPDDLGLCALGLGFARARVGDGDSALEAYSIALAVFRSNNTRSGETTVLSNIGEVYRAQGRYEQALDYYQQARDIARDIDDQGSEATAVNNIGGVYHVQGQYEQALDYYQQALTIQQETGDRKGEATTRNNIGSIYDTQGRYQEALEQFQTALTIRVEVDDQRGRAISLNNIGSVYQSQGRYAEAQERYQQALPIFRTVADRRNEVTTLNNIGTVYSLQGCAIEALKYHQQALDIVQTIDDRSSEAITYNNIGVAYQQQGRYAEALKQYQQALPIYRELDDQANEGTTLTNIGTVYSAQGRYADALNNHRQALQLKREIGDRAGQGTAFNNIGSVYDDQSRYAEALEQYDQALQIAREVGDRDGEASALNNVGAIFAGQGRYAEALEQYQQALVIYQALGNRSGEASTRTNLGAIDDDQGRYTEALEQYEQALAIQRNIGNRDGEAAVLNNLGLIYSAQSRYDEALDVYRQALTIQQEIGDRIGENRALSNIGQVYGAQEQTAQALEYYQQALIIAREVGDPQGEYTALNNIGAAYQEQEQYDDALEYLQQALRIQQTLGDRLGEALTLGNIALAHQEQERPTDALAANEKAMGILEIVRAGIGSEPGRAGLIAQFDYVYERATQLYYQQGQVAKAFYTTERGRARAFLDSLATGQVELADDTANALFQREQEAYAVRQSVQDALIRARAQTPDDAALIVDLEAQLKTAEADYAAVQQEIAARSDQLAMLAPGRVGAALTLDRVQSHLDKQTTLVSYYVGETTAFAFVITQSDAQIIELPISRAALRSLVQTLGAFDDRFTTHPATAVQLYKQLIASLQSHLNTPNLIIVPHSVLHYLPFAALTDGQRFLVDGYTLTTLPSASVLPFVQRAAARPGAGAPLVLGNPDGTLPLAAAEARAVAAILDAAPLLGRAAGETTLRAQATQAVIIHLATHGFYDAQNPLESYATLAGANGDDRLETREVYELNLAQAELVVLSACETQLGSLSQGDEIVGLTRAFFFAGSPRVLATLWRVDDAATQLLMEQFYTHLRAGVSQAESLRLAQRDVREHRDDTGRQPYTSPYYWAGFVLSGDADAPLAPWQRVPWWGWVVGCVVGFGVSVLVLRYTRRNVPVRCSK